MRKLLFIPLVALLFAGCGAATDDTEDTQTTPEDQKTIATECELLKWDGDAWICYFTNKRDEFCTIYEYGHSGGISCTPEKELDPAVEGGDPAPTEFDGGS